MKYYNLSNLKVLYKNYINVIKKHIDEGKTKVKYESQKVQFFLYIILPLRFFVKFFLILTSITK
jgi:hypothetical protein